MRVSVYELQTPSILFDIFKRYNIVRKVFRVILYTCLILCATLATQGETVSQKEAKRLATQFFNAAHGQVMAEPKFVYNGRRLTTNSLFPPFYVYNHPAGGFVVISAENKAFPILGYSLTETFDPDVLQPVTKALLRLYALHIENIRYDSTVPHEAVEAWGDLQHYIADILDAPYRATDPVTTVEEAQQELDRLLEMNDASAFTSAVYSPQQWQDAIDSELLTHPDVVLGLIGEKGLVPVIVHGRKGDYYRMRLDGPNTSLWRLLPTEILTKGEVAMLGTPSYVAPLPVEEEPHTFYTDFVRESESERAAADRALEETLIPTEPVVRGHGGGHFTISLPAPVREMRLYSLDGSMVQRDKFRDTDTAVINLSNNPVGFYFAVFFGDDGRHWSVKLFR